MRLLLTPLARHVSCLSAIVAAILVLSSFVANAGISSDLRDVIQGSLSVDLRIDSFVLNKSEAIVGETLRATVGISNQGRSAAPSTLLTFWATPGSTTSTSNAYRLATVRLGTLQSSSRITYVGTFPVPNFGRPGTYQILTTVDSSKAETNKQNNPQAKSLQVISPATPVSYPVPSAPPLTSTSPGTTVTTAPSATGSPDLKYKAYLDGVLARNSASLETNAQNPISKACAGCVTIHYVLDGVTAMYEATKDPAYIAMALGWAEAVIAAATITDSGGYQNWPGSSATSYSSTPIATQLDDLQLGYGLARVARVTLLDSALRTQHG